MNKLCICDLDGVVCNNDARFAKAEEAMAAYLAAQDTEDAAKHHGLDYIRKEGINIYWQTAFTPDLVALDTLIDDVSWSLNRIEDAGYEVIYLTSRPETLRKATTKWFHTLPEKHGLRGRRITPESKLGIDQLIMKPVSQQFVKTVTWKAGVVELLVRLFGVDELLYVDDEQAHCNAVEALDLDCDRILCGNLQEAIVSIGGA